MNLILYQSVTSRLDRPMFKFRFAQKNERSDMESTSSVVGVGVIIICPYNTIIHSTKKKISKHFPSVS